jgi:preprotein translocase SecE subunit
MKKDSTKKEKKVTVKKEKSTKKKKGLFKGIKSYFKGVKKEIGRIRWTSGKDLVKYSIATIMFVLFFGVYFYLIDLAVAFIRSLA